MISDLGTARADLLFRCVRAIPTAAATAVASFQMVEGGKNQIARGRVDRVIDPFHELFFRRIRQVRIRLSVLGRRFYRSAVVESDDRDPRDSRR